LAAPAAQKKGLQEVVPIIKQYQERQHELGCHVPTYTADIISLCLSLGRVYARSDSGAKSAVQHVATELAQWLVQEALAIVQQGYTRGEGRAPVALSDLAVLAASLRSLAAINKDRLSGLTLQLAQELTEHTSQRVSHTQQNGLSLRAWSDLLWGLTAAGVNLGNTSSLLVLLEQGAMQVARLLSSSRSQGTLQDISLILVAYVHAGYAGDLSALVKALASRPQSRQAKDRDKGGPQELSNMLWALGKLGQANPSAYSPALFDWALHQLHSMVDQARPQHLSSAVYACALARHSSSHVAQLLRAICQHPTAMASAKLQEWANLLWAAATLQSTGTSQLHDKLYHCAQQLLQQFSKVLVSSPGALAGQRLGRSAQEWSNILWAAAMLRWYEEALFSCGTAAVAASKGTTVRPQALSCTLNAAAECAHWDAHILQLVQQLSAMPVEDLNHQVLSNALYSWAVLMSCAQEGAATECTTAAAQFFQQASQRPVSGYSREGLGQLLAAHMYAEAIGKQGLPDGEVLQAALSVGWVQGQVIISDSQRQVARVLDELGYRVAVEQTSPDGMMSADVVVSARPSGDPCSIAIEFDGPSHYVTQHNSTCANDTQPDSAMQQQDSEAPAQHSCHRLDGSSRLRNALLRARYPGGVVCVPCYEWNALASEQQKQQYMQHALESVHLQAA
jgi:hypothetical protein